MERNGRQDLGIKSMDFGDGLAVRSTGGDLKDDIQDFGFYTQWVVVPLAEMGKNGRLLCWGT